MPKKGMNNTKLENKVSKMIVKFEKKCQKQEKEIEVSRKTQNQLKDLLSRIPKDSKEFDKELANEFKQISKEFSKSMKSIKQEMKNEKRKIKEQKKSERKERKQKREQKQKDLENSRIEELPELKENELKCLNIIVDGWNICGCDKIARKCMRGKRASGAKRMIYLLQIFGLMSNYMKSNGKNVNLIIHFDGNGKDRIDELNGVKVNVLFSGKNEIVDDRLVRELGKNVSNIKIDELLSKESNPIKISENPNRNNLVVTSDRELTLRLNKIGVAVMKSGAFYKKYLKEFEFEGLKEANESNENESKEEIIEFSAPKIESKGKNNKYENKHKNKKHWKKYIKNRFSDNSSSSSDSDGDAPDFDLSDSDSDEMEAN